MAKLSNEWWNNFRGDFDTEEEVFKYIFDRVDTSDYEDSYINVAGYGDPNECIKQTAADKRELLWDFMMQILEEIWQYRALEKRLSDIFNRYVPLSDVVNELERNLKEPNNPHPINAKILTYEDAAKWEVYKSIGTLEECRAAVEKQRAKEAIANIKVEPIIDENGAYIDAETFCYLACPCCGNQVGIDEELDNYCSNCGQKLKME